MSPPEPTPVASSAGFFRLLERESPTSLRKLMGLAALAGLGSALVLATINAAAASAAEDAHSFRQLLFFALAACAAAYTERHVLDLSARSIEQALDRLRARITDKLRRAELLPLDHIGRSEIYASVTRETVALSQGVPVLLMACRSAIIIVFVTLYLAAVSLPACLLTVSFAVIGTVLYIPRARGARREIEVASAHENEFYDTLTHLLDGLREIKLHQPRSDALYERAVAISNATAEAKIAAYIQFALLNTFSQGLFYLLIGSIVFVVPHFTEEGGEVVTKCTAAILFLLGPVAALSGGLPTAVSAGVSSRNIEILEATLDRYLEASVSQDTVPRTSFSRITLEGLTFEYRDDRGRCTFGLGPLDIEIQAGQAIFLVGGNGSGKTTLLMLLTGLYRPHSGRVLFDGKPLDESNLAAYRSLFTAVFSEYHLFDRLYGLEGVSAERVDDVLRQMELADKTRLVDGRFEMLKLSSGQRKRLALAVALLEDRPILVFDEWAAEQDPEFRQHFYDDVLRQLKAQGKTLVIVTHDDRYYHASYIDEVRKVKQGKFIPFLPTEPRSPDA